MKKIPTIFERDWEGTIGRPGARVLNKIVPNCEWVFMGHGVATRKLDGTACLIINEKLYKRHEVKSGKDEPYGFTLAALDVTTGKKMGWVPVGEGPEDTWHREAFRGLLLGPRPVRQGTYELTGGKIQGNPEKTNGHVLTSHNDPSLILNNVPRDYNGLKTYFDGKDIEGIVWHHIDGRMAKIKLKDFGLKRKANVLSRPSPRLRSLK